MTNAKPVEILCPACGQESLLKRTSRYDGFTRIGENMSCASCGHVFADEASVPFKTKKTLAGFDRKDVPAAPRVFRQNENARLCRYCENYVVNPFVQRCSRLKKEVEATDTCEHFKPKPEPTAPAKPAPPKPVL
ncbi:MAG: hypothetical protein KKG09_02335 [Verrucomicrobia bacterium]|nr:hypothetical protein [Verrucomicrobiota bacterium]MCG2679048.1 hypothetical protein [Kiritimatiellia bacterium]MBU4247574.1 hypothetical protein [Verrucomicrobiota bacterium]MBU4291188.1 hypothetical protein [Verrucomicrobiota bacterium]MBU4428469.1 hypothetical protein [Verrucomicrobiota bacterium]